MPRQDDSLSIALTSSDDLIGQVRFSPSNGRIWLGKNRMLLLHASGFGVLRRELIETLGLQKARGILTRMGYHNGSNDAVIANEQRYDGSNPVDFMLFGPKLHMLEGTGSVLTVSADIDEESGRFNGEFIWQDSAEAEAHIKSYGLGNYPACWMQIGYASGFVSSYMGRPILFREVECAAQGAKACRIVGKAAEEWEDAEEDLGFLRANQITQGISSNDNKEDDSNPLGLDDVVGVSAGFNAVCHKILRVGDTQATVLFLGESGAGKEVFAKSLHRISPRNDKPFIAVNCAAIPENLVESELFGVEKGAFTGATHSRPGRFERANGGTIFLDEIGILNKTAQGKLLRVLQEREIERVGGHKTLKLDVRVIAATNLNLREEVEKGHFREDLFYRLNVFPITVPSLRDRLEDIPVFMNYFLRKFRQRHQRNVPGFTSQAVATMMEYHWPGNVRELENLVERGVIMASDNESIDTFHLFSEDEYSDMKSLTLNPSGQWLATCDDDEKTQSATDGDDPYKLLQLMDLQSQPVTMHELEMALIQKALETTDGNKSAAARLLGISRSQLLYRLKDSTNTTGGSEP